MGDSIIPKDVKPGYHISSASRSNPPSDHGHWQDLGGRILTSQVSKRGCENLSDLCLKVSGLLSSRPVSGILGSSVPSPPSTLSANRLTDDIMPALPLLQLADKSELAGWRAPCLLQACLSFIREGKHSTRLVRQAPAERRFKVMRLRGLVLGTVIWIVGYA